MVRFLERVQDVLSQYQEGAISEKEAVYWIAVNVYEMFGEKGPEHGKGSR